MEGPPLELTRTELLYGMWLRRELRRAEARVHLHAALDAYERFDATLWAERARAELRASGETARKRDPAPASSSPPRNSRSPASPARG